MTRGYSGAKQFPLSDTSLAPGFFSFLLPPAFRKTAHDLRFYFITVSRLFNPLNVNNVISRIEKLSSSASDMFII
jgi:hypothetical protein